MKQKEIEKPENGERSKTMMMWSTYSSHSCWSLSLKLNLISFLLMRQWQQLTKKNVHEQIQSTDETFFRTRFSSFTSSSWHSIPPIFSSGNSSQFSLPGLGIQGRNVMYKFTSLIPPSLREYCLSNQGISTVLKGEKCSWSLVSLTYYPPLPVLLGLSDKVITRASHDLFVCTAPTRNIFLQMSRDFIR
jgi:hypothetical protein